MEQVQADEKLHLPRGKRSNRVGSPDLIKEGFSHSVVCARRQRLAQVLRIAARAQRLVIEDLDKSVERLENHAS